MDEKQTGNVFQKNLDRYVETQKKDQLDRWRDQQVSTFLDQVRGLDMGAAWLVENNMLDERVRRLASEMLLRTVEKLMPWKTQKIEEKTDEPTDLSSS